MAGSGARTPYVITLVCRYRDGYEVRYAQGRRRHLATALQEAKRAETTWLQLIGGQFSPLHWLVIDVRDYRVYSPFQPIPREEDSGQQGTTGQGVRHAGFGRRGATG